MSIEVGSAFVSILPSMKGIGKNISRELDPAAEAAGKSAGKKAGGGLASTMKGAITPVTAGLAGLAAVHVLGGFIADARESAKIAAITAQVIKTTGGAAKITAGQVSDLATSISNKTGIDDEAIQSGENLLLTFTNVKNEAGAGNDIFNQTTKIMTDMSVALGTDAKGSAIQLGKALNDPVKGVTALQKVGVSFTAQQKAQIKTLVESGNTLGAQKVILTELGHEFGGAAEAAATPSAKLKVTMGNLAETIGALLIPAVDFVATSLNNLTTFVTNNTSAISIVAAVIGTVLLPLIIRWGIESTISAAKSVIAWAISSAGAVAGGAVYVASGIAVVGAWLLMGAQALIGAARMAAAWLISLGPVGLVIAAIVGVTLIVIKNWDTIRNATVAVWGAISSFVLGVVNTVVGFVSSHWKLLLAILTGPIGAAVIVIATHWSAIKSGVVDTFDTVKRVISGALDAVKKTISGGLDAVVGFFSGLGRRISSIASGAFDGVKSAFRSAINFVIDGWNGLHFSLPSFSAFGHKVGGATIGLPQIPHLAAGGIVDRPTLALIGEAGPEAVVPLKDGGIGGGKLEINNYTRPVGPAELMSWLDQYNALHGSALLIGG